MKGHSFNAARFSSLVKERPVYTILSFSLDPAYRVAHHGVRLARAGLAVGEETGVVALKGRLQHLRPQVLEQLKATKKRE